MRRRTMTVCLRLLLGSCLLAAAGAAEPKGAAGRPALPAYRIEPDGFDAGERDIRAVLDSAAGALWQHFPGATIEPIVVVRGHAGPITLYKRNDRREIVVRLDTGKTYWSQYAYQFGHEFCHVLCGYREGYEGNKWFEETVCETASLFVLRSMARSWKDAPPFPNWADYRDALRAYADEVIRKRDKLPDVYAHGFGEFYRAHRAELEGNPTSRELNGAMAVALLHLFEERPERWEAVRWLNAAAAPKGETFAAYLQRWHDAAPARHRPFVRQVAEMYGAAVRDDRAP